MSRSQEPSITANVSGNGLFVQMSESRGVPPILFILQIDGLQLVLMRMVRARIYFDESHHPIPVAMAWQHSIDRLPQNLRGVGLVLNVSGIDVESARIAAVRKVLFTTPLVLSSKLNVPRIDHHAVIPVHLRGLVIWFVFTLNVPH